MPILDVEMVVSQPLDQPRKLAQRIADATADLFEAGERRVWVRLRELPESHYAENGKAVSGTLPIFIDVLKSSSDSRDIRRQESVALAELIASACDRPKEHVHVLYAPPAAGRIAFGGLLMEG